MRDLIYKHALINAVDHEGKADIQAVLGKVISGDSSLREKNNSRWIARFTECYAWKGSHEASALSFRAFAYRECQNGNSE